MGITTITALRETDTLITDHGISQVIINETKSGSRCSCCELNLLIHYK